MAPPVRARLPLLALLAAGLLAAPSRSSCFAENATAVALPSGLAAVSELLVGGSELALDTNGSLFRSEDHGRQWRQVHQQWQGKAIELLGMPALTSLPANGQAPRTDTEPETYAAVLLKSSAALHWVSVDRGKTWRPSKLDDVRRNDIKWSGY